MHQSVMDWVAAVVDRHNLHVAATLEVGSYDVNGSVRRFFHGRYWGVDMRDGPGVDQVLTSHQLDQLTERFDVVISTEMLEHDAMPWRSVPQMRDRLNPGGLLILTARGYDERGCFPVHDYPGDYWRYSVDGLAALIADSGMDVVEATSDPETPGVFAIGRAR